MSQNPSQLYLVPSKMSAPRLASNIIPRSRLDFLKKTDESLTILCAPAGFGKTTAALQAYSHQQEIDPSVALAWLSLDPEDDDPHYFCSYFVSAIGLSVSLSQSLLNAALDPKSQIKVIFGQLLFELSRIKQDVVITLDDYQHVQNEEITKTLAYFIRNLSAGNRLIITTRSEPPAAIMGLKTRGLIHEINMEDLAFDALETRSFLSQSKKFQVADKESDEIQQFIEGWPVGLQLLMMGFKGDQTFSEFKQQFVRYQLNVIDYFDAEVFELLPNEVKLFMVRVSVVGRFNPEIANRLNPNENNYKTIEYLQRSHLLISQTDGNKWFRFHHLLREFLFHKLQLSDMSVEELHEDACQALLDQKYIVAATDHAIASGNKALLSDLLIQFGDKLLHKAHYEVVSQCLAILPLDDVLIEPRLLQLKCWVEAIYGDASQVELLISRSNFNNMCNSVAHQNDFDIEFAIIRAQAFYALGEFEDALAFSGTALQKIGNNGIRRQSVLIIQANILFEQGQLSRALSLYGEVSLLAMKSHNHDAVLWALAQQAQIYKALAQFERSQSVARDAVQYAEDQNVNYGFNYLFANLDLADIALEQYHLREARQLINKMGKICQNWEKHWSVHLLGWLLKSELLKGKSSVSKDLSSQHAKILSSNQVSTQLISFSVEIQLLYWWRQNELEQINLWYSVSQPLENYVNSAACQVLRGELYALLAMGRTQEVIGKINAQLDDLQSTELLLEKIKFQLLLVVAVSMRDKERAISLFKSLLPELVRNHLVSSVLLYRTWLTSILELIDIHDLRADERKFIEQLLLLERQKNTSLTAGREAVPDTLIALGISKKEWIVFEKIIQGLSNDEIAGSMFVAVSTVKTHINNLYKKLGVKSRSQAINKSNELF